MKLCQPRILDRPVSRSAAWWRPGGQGPRRQYRGQGGDGRDRFSSHVSLLFPGFSCRRMTVRSAASYPFPLGMATPLCGCNPRPQTRSVGVSWHPFSRVDLRYGRSIPVPSFASAKNSHGRPFGSSPDRRISVLFTRSCRWASSARRRPPPMALSRPRSSYTPPLLPTEKWPITGFEPRPPIQLP